MNVIAVIYPYLMLLPYQVKNYIGSLFRHDFPPGYMLEIRLVFIAA